ncbi:MAG: 3-octaprenyl-4-hydroxybenzoate carboxy-lyase UbiD [Candidatus Magnetoglobus multicellularis str. Araruama]|uniref:3-octaprenyl-4-hydroxybenzoate carboxy-lyase UbiD n=1 Tax=Candidatus Magnetoglobus multicellularis str. Araruama TaxID=890399 RepID=A0A1V1P4K5_9BACT|nr:MAG: 3-octaprenyl-4-hydroxybenzoate carboxy-lyase UbiD [Candidatus Magnetoglobus multicellularis str. Araruama]
MAQKKRLRWLFHHSQKAIQALFALKKDPLHWIKNPSVLLRAPKAAGCAIPKKVSTGPVLSCTTQISQLPQLVSWPLDGGAYITLPQVYSENITSPGWMHSNLGMYRIQLSGNQFQQNREVGLHYQIHRGIGFHHSAALKANKPFHVNIFIGGPPAMTLAAIMPLPEGIPELAFAGVLAGHRIPMIYGKTPLPILAEADFCITGTVIPNYLLPEGPFGDHLGYYSLKHDFPVLHVKNVFHRKDAIWPFTTVARPPQEDSIIGEWIHELTSSLVPSVFSGIHHVHAVDAAGVHPLLLAIGSERYVPFCAEQKPQELLTGAFSLLGNTQTSLSKYLWITTESTDAPCLNIKDIPGFFKHMLERVQWERDVHVITQTTMDTLDYSGINLNQGSKVIIAACGLRKRQLGTSIPDNLWIPEPFSNLAICLPGILVIQGPKHEQERNEHDHRIQHLAQALADQKNPDLSAFPLIVVADNSNFVSQHLDNFLWVTFTRSDPATDIYGTNEFIHCKHWGCKDCLIIDARLKKHHASPLEPDF